MSRRDERIPILILHLIAVVQLSLALYVRSLPETATAIPEAGSAESHWWGMWPITYLPNWIFFCGLGLIFCVMAALWYRELRGPLKPQRWASQISTVQIRQQWLYLFLVGGFIGAFYLFPIVHTRWGDAYILTKAMAHPDPAIRLTHSWQAPLDVFLHSQVWQSGHTAMGWQDAMPVYHLLSPLAGLLYLGAAIAVGRESLRTLGIPQWLSIGLLTSLGVMQLFFGYIENYSFAAAGILIYLWLSLLAFQEKCSLWIASLALAITNALHPSTIVYWPSMLFLYWQSTCRHNRLRAAHIFQLLLPPLLVAAATIAMMEWGGHGIEALLTTDRPGGGDARWLVPFWATTTRWEHYTMLSWPHLRDIINEQLLVAPILLPAFCTALALSVWLRRYMGKQTEPAEAVEGQIPTVNSHYRIFLTIATACHLALTWIWNPDYGGQRDWDLFSLALIPTALLTAKLLATAIANPRTLQAGMIPLLMLQYAQLATWVYQNTLQWQWP